MALATFKIEDETWKRYQAYCKKLGSNASYQIKQYILRTLGDISSESDLSSGIDEDIEKTIETLIDERLSDIDKRVNTLIDEGISDRLTFIEKNLKTLIDERLKDALNQISPIGKPDKEQVTLSTNNPSQDAPNLLENKKTDIEIISQTDSQLGLFSESKGEWLTGKEAIALYEKEGKTIPEKHKKYFPRNCHKYGFEKTEDQPYQYRSTR